MKQTLRLLSLMADLLLASSGAFALGTWEEVVVNGNFEGSDCSAFSIYDTKGETTQDFTANMIVTDVNDANNHCAQVEFPANPWSCQFIIKLSKPLSAGDLFQFSMRARSSATKDLVIMTELMGNFNVKQGTAWNTFSFEGVVNEELAGKQSIVLSFNRNTPKTCIYYFDDISMQVKDGNTPIVFTDPLVKEICVNNWDLNSDGELGLSEAASVTSLAEKFMSTNITSFDELQYFTGLTYINNRDFYGCTSLKSIIIPSNVIEISGSSDWASTFKWCWNLESVTLGDKVEVIGYDAFYHCESLASINFPKSLTWIGDEAFYGCISLKELNIPKELENIGESAFTGCAGLTSIVVEEGNSFYDSRNNCNCLIETRSNRLIRGSANSVIPNTVRTIDREAFSNCTGLTTLTIPKSVTTIGYGAFSGCSGLLSIVVEEGNPNYDSRNNCNALIETATDSLIAGCNNTIIPNNVTAIAPYAFLGCAGLTSINIPRSVKNIGMYAFQNCSGPNLLSITVEEGNPTYDSRNNCNALIETAADSLIFGCKKTLIPHNVKAIGIYAFSGCVGMNTIRIPNSVKYIYGGTFQNCIDLSTIIFGNSLERLESFAFLGCPNIKDVYCYAEQVTDAKGMYGNSVFSFDMSKATLHVPAALVDAYKAETPWSWFGTIVALTDGDPEPNGITNIHHDSMAAKRYYSLDGKERTTLHRGLNIIKMSDGTTKKVVVK